MSLVVLKRKAATQYGGRRSNGSAATTPPAVWMPRYPLLCPAEAADQPMEIPGHAGFSLNGTKRNVRGVGRDSRMSTVRTPFRGVHPVANGGFSGQYVTAAPIWAVSPSSPAETPDRVAPSVASYSATRRPPRHKFVHHGAQYPLIWVQPIYTGDQVGSCGYENYYRQRNAEVVRCDPAYDHQEEKKVPQALPYDLYLIRRTRACADPVGEAKPFPMAVRSGKACVSAPVYLTPPDWYWHPAESTNNAGGGVP